MYNICWSSQEYAVFPKLILGSIMDIIIDTSNSIY
jgi:hypothetical protein